MNHELLNLAADVIEKAAAYVDAVEAEKADVIASERSKVALAIKSRYEEATGEDLPEEIVSKIASSDLDVIKFVEKISGSTQAPDSIGGPGEARGEAAEPRNRKEAAVAADEQFAAWLTS